MKTSPNLTLRDNSSVTNPKQTAKTLLRPQAPQRPRHGHPMQGGLASQCGAVTRLSDSRETGQGADDDAHCHVCPQPLLRTTKGPRWGLLWPRS